VDALAPPAELSRDTAPRFSPVPAKSAPTDMNQKIEQLERLGTLRKNDMISESEHERLKSEILGNI
jgi:chaperonin cofactor prefoldin